MSDYISIKQYDEMNVTAKDDRIMYDVSHTSGIVKGCEISYSGGNTIHIGAGYGIVKGALFEIYEHDETIQLTESGTKLGQIYVHFDLSSATPIDIIVEVATTLSTLEHDEDANFINGQYDIQLCTFTVGTTTLSNVTTTYPLVTGASDFALDFVGKRVHFNSDGSIRTTYQTGEYVVTSFPSTAICKDELYSPGGTLLATKVTSVDSNNGDILETVTPE